MFLPEYHSLKAGFVGELISVIREFYVQLHKTKNVQNKVKAAKLNN